MFVFLNTLGKNRKRIKEKTKKIDIDNSNNYFNRKNYDIPWPNSSRKGFPREYVLLKTEKAISTFNKDVIQLFI